VFDPVLWDHTAVAREPSLEIATCEAPAESPGSLRVNPPDPPQVAEFPEMVAMLARTDDGLPSAVHVAIAVRPPFERAKSTSFATPPLPGMFTMPVDPHETVGIYVGNVPEVIVAEFE
jgi:hypothetical protein